MLLLKAISVAALIRGTYGATVSLFAPGFGPDNNLQGVVGGTNSIGTSYILSGVTDDISFTVTLVANPSEVAEDVVIPSLTLSIDAGCFATDTNGDAVCQEIVAGGQAGGTQTVTVSTAFAPIAIAVSTSGAASGTTSTVNSTSTASLPLSITSTVPLTTITGGSSASQSTITSPTTLPMSTVSSRPVASASSNTISASASQSASSAAAGKGEVNLVFFLPMLISVMFGGFLVLV